MQGELIAFIEGVHVQAANLTRVPEIQEAVRQAFQRRPDEKTFADDMQRIEQQWPALTPENSRFLSDILGHRASQFLREYNRVVAMHREILVADRYGRLVAASAKSTDYFQADENWWRVAFLEGKGQRYISDIEFDESAGVYSLVFAEPIRDEATGSVLGVIKAVVDDHELFRILDSIRLGQETAAVVFRSDGTMVSSLDSPEKYPFASPAAAALSRGIRFIEVPEAEPRFLLGIPSSTLQSGVPELGWTLVVEAPRGEVFAPFLNLRRWFLYFVAFSVGLVIFLAVVFSWVLSKPIIETDPHLESV